MNRSKKFRLVESAVCTAVALTILSIAAACGSGSGITSLLPGTKAVLARISNHPKGHGSIEPKIASGPSLAAFMFQAGAPTPSQLPESFEGTCDLTDLTPGSVTGFVILNIPNGIPCGNGGGVQATGNVGGVNGAGIPVAFDGTITVLKVSVLTQANQHLRCIATNGTAAVSDNDSVQPYYDIDTNTAVLGIGTNQLPISCQVPVAAGDSAQKITVEWSKS
jgi:hypothetical protein